MGFRVQGLGFGRGGGFGFRALGFRVAILQL